MERIPQNVSEAVRVAAGAARGYPGDLADIHRRVRRRRNRQALVCAAAVVAVLGAAAAGAAAWRRPTAPVVTPAATGPARSAEPSPSTAPTRRDPAQPLILDAAAGSYRGSDGRTVVLGGDKRIGELLPGGELRGHPVAGSRNWEKAVVVLPDGSLVAFGSHDTTPGVERTDGPNVSGLEYRLVGVDSDGTVSVQRNIRRKGEPVTLVTSTATTAYLWRPAGLAEHDLATGAERIVVKKAALGFEQVFGSLRMSDLAGDRLVVAGMNDECKPSVYDIATSRRVAALSLHGSKCVAVNAMRLSPDGSKLAVAYQHEDASAGLLSSVAVIRVADGTVITRRPEPEMGTTQASWATSLAWADEQTVRAASYLVGAEETSEVTAFTMTAG
ncbi:hypothetical protein [Actinoplanes utahensis]|uniref:WD40 repeat domain-containing protein n=1 Tax=Actinoplanes utahensis TaxID=1869 RepID=A0A0A6UKG0_ACTUT|nr:hypothetical protein [Actinoplanes utahensis]KHD75926.1 hypothetical protein MB27_19965 [Actinoplanes utahensis]GIF35028.1 hypothetical protein Aut01nite_80140 [Actinoplanes utahensis]